MTISPAAIVAVGATVDPTVILGSLTITPTEATVVGTVVDPSVVEGLAA